MIAIYAARYCLVCILKMLRTTPAMVAGLMDRPWGWEEIAGMLVAEVPTPERPTTYKKSDVKLP